MAWTMEDYPPSLKNFDSLTRRKIIDIANGMIAEGYDEDRAIPIAISQGKEWIQNATASEKKSLKEKNITDHEKSPSTPSRLQDRNVEIRYRDEEKKWEVRTVGAKRADSLHDTKKEAQERGAEITKYRKGKVISHKKDKTTG